MTINDRDAYILTHGTEIAERRIRAAMRLQANETARRASLLSRSIRVIAARIHDAFRTAAETARAAN